MNDLYGLGKNAGVPGASNFGGGFAATGGAFGGAEAMQKGWDDYWATSQPGSMPFAGGTLTRNPNGTASFRSPDGRVVNYSRSTSFAQLAAQSPEIAAQWQKDFGFGAIPNAGAGIGGVQNTPGTISAPGGLPSQMPAGSTGGTGALPPGMNGRPFTADAPGNAGGVGSVGSGGSGGGFGGLVQGVNVNEYSQNPYLAQMGTVLTNRVTDNLDRNIMPGIRSNAIAAGGFGGSRQGVVEANAMRDANQTISDALTGAYFQDFTNSMNRNLQQYGQNQGFYSNQRGQDLAQIGLGASLFNQGNQGFLGQGQGIYGLGTTQQQAPWQVVNNGNAGFGQWSGFGTTTQAGGGAQGVLGGALAGGQLGSLFGGGNTSGVSAPAGGYGANANYGLSSGGSYGLQAPTSWGMPG